MNYFKFFFVSFLIYMSLMGWCSNNWIMIWLIMEIMFLFFLGLMSLNINYSLIESIVKYFILQVFISLILASIIMFSFFNLVMLTNHIMLIVLFCKLGLFPFHFWVISILGKLDWLSFFIMLTFMKLLPILMIYYVSNESSFNLIIISSIGAGSVLGLCNTSIQKLLGYSSMVHLGWMFFSLGISFKTFLLYFFCYLFMFLVLINIFDLLNVFYINQFVVFSSNFITKFLVFFLILSMCGFPPFMGFIMKWVVINFIILFNMKVLCFFAVFLSVLSTFFYFQLFYYIMMLSSLSVKWYNLSLNYIWCYLIMFFILGFYLILYFFI